jgi:hypothetical protein
MRTFIDIVEKATRPINTDSPAFRHWFGQSKVVDAKGDPLRVFHGGAADIKAFDKATIGKNFGVDKEGFFFTTNTSFSTSYYGPGDTRVYNDMYSAGAYANNAEGATYPCFLRIENPLLIADWAEWHGLSLDHAVADYGHVQDVLDRYKKSIIQTAREDGNDGVIASHGNDHVFVVFEPNQIKSVFNTSFSRDSDDISEAVVAPFAKWKRWWGNLQTGDLLAVPDGMEHDQYAEANVDEFLDYGTIDLLSQHGEWWENNDAWLEAIYEAGWQAILWDGSTSSLMLRQQGGDNNKIIRKFVTKVAKSVPVESVHIDLEGTGGHASLTGRDLQRFIKTGLLPQ